MSVRSVAVILAVIGVIMAPIDLFWISVVANSFYNDQLGPLLAEAPVAWAAVAFYLMYMGAVAYFAVIPALRTDKVRVALLNGAVLGFVAYGTYDLTNLATLAGWPVPLVVVDMLWGTVLTASVAGLSFVVIKSTLIKQLMGKAA